MTPASPRADPGATVRLDKPAGGSAGASQPADPNATTEWDPAEIARLAEIGDDKGLAQISEAARKKADYQIGRVEGHVMDRTRKAAGRGGLVLSNVGEFLKPRAAPQERTFSALWPLGEIAPSALAATTVALACEHLARVSRRDAAHAVMSFKAARACAEEESCGERCV